MLTGLVGAVAATNKCLAQHDKSRIGKTGQKALKPCRQRPLGIADQYANRCWNVPSCGGGRMLRFGVRTVQSTTERQVSSLQRAECLIKDNINPKGERIHMPGQRYYDKTIINPSKVSLSCRLINKRWALLDPAAR
jgi:hypothetical protein